MGLGALQGMPWGSEVGSRPADRWAPSVPLGVRPWGLKGEQMAQIRALSPTLCLDSGKSSSGTSRSHLSLPITPTPKSWPEGCPQPLRRLHHGWAGASKAATPGLLPGGQKRRPRLPGLAGLGPGHTCQQVGEVDVSQVRPRRRRRSALGPSQPLAAVARAAVNMVRIRFCSLSLSWTVSWGSIPWSGARPAGGC